MVEALQRRVQRYGWDKAAPYYEALWHQQLQPAHDRLVNLARIKAGDNILDLACGTGLISFRALQATGPAGYVLGTDLSDKMIELCQQAAITNQCTNARFERMDGEALSLADGEFDLALCALGLMYMPNPDQALKELWRVLKPQGRCVTAVWGARRNCGWADIFAIVDKRVASEVCPLFFNLGHDGMLQKSLATAGFSRIRTERITTELQYNSAAEACAAAFEGGPVALAYFKFAEPVKQEACEEYLASIEQYRDGTKYTIPGEFVIGTGIK